VRDEHPKAPQLRRSNAVLICMFALGAVALGIIERSLDAFLISVGIFAASVALAPFSLESVGLLPSGSAPRLARRRITLCS
jgi:hypothetical protein